METVAELKARLKQAEALEEEQELAQRKALQVEWKTITNDRNSWEWSVQPTTQKPFFSHDKELHGIRLACRIKPSVVELWTKTHNGIPPFDRATDWQGMFYYRTSENILTYSGGGSHVLNSEPKLCTDQQWNELVAGRVPDKIRGNWLGGV